MYAILIPLVLIVGLMQIVLGFIGIEYWLGAGWAIGSVVLALWLRIMLPLTVGTYIAIVHVLDFAWWVGILAAAPGLVIILPSMFSDLISGASRSLEFWRLAARQRAELEAKARAERYREELEAKARAEKERAELEAKKRAEKERKKKQRRLRRRIESYATILVGAALVIAYAITDADQILLTGVGTGALRPQQTLAETNLAEPMASRQADAETPLAATSNEHLSKLERLVVEVALQSKGYGRLAIDGHFDPITIEAIKNWQADNDYEADAILTREQYDRLRND